MDEEELSPLMAGADAASDPATGYLGLIASQFQTSHEAQARARQVLDMVTDTDVMDAGESDILQQYRDTAEDARAALRRARESILADKYDNRQLWLAAAQGLGAPTRTGQFGETIGNLAGALRQPFAEREEFRRGREDKLLDVDTALSEIDQRLAATELGVAQKRRDAIVDLAGDAFRVLGKSVTTGAPKPPGGTQALDRAMASMVVEWTTTGSADAQKSLAELSDAIDIMGQSDTISGPWVGLVPKSGRDWLWPESGDVQDLIETTAQKSLRQILGAQFAQKEGEMLLARTFNPRLDENINRRRATRLFKLIEQAAKEKDRAAAYFMDHGTMAGYTGKTQWTMADFEPEPELITVLMPDGGTIDVPDNWTQGQVIRYYDESKRTGGQSEKYKRTENQSAEFRRGGWVVKKRRKPKFQAGGPVRLEDLEEDDDGVTELEEIGGGITPMDALRTGAGALAGTAAGLGVEEGYARLHEMNQNLDRPSRGRQLVGVSMDTAGTTAGDVATEMKRGRRMGVPEVPLDLSGNVTRELGERALMVAGPVGDVALEMLEERHQESRERVGRQIEKGLKTPEFYETEDKLTDRLYTRAKPLYEKAFEATVPVPSWWGKMQESSFGRKAIDKALFMMREEGVSIGKADIAGMVQNPSLKFMDYIKRAYDQMILKEEAGTFTTTPMSRIMKQQRSRLVTYLDANGPDEYKQARAQYKGDKEVLEALHVGRDSYYRMPPEEARRMVQGMSEAEKYALRAGVAQRLYEIIYAPSTDIAAARRLIGSPEMRDRLELLFERPREWRVFEAALRREMDLFEKGKKTLTRAERGRSRRQVQQVLDIDDPLSTIKTAISKGPMMWALRMLPWTWSGKASLTEEDADEIVRILTHGDPRELERLAPNLDYATRYAKTRRGRRGKAALVGAAVGAALGAIGLGGDEEEEEEEAQ